jgi:hypothetical protein
MFDFRRAFGACVAIGMLAGCGGSQMTGAASASTTGVQSATRSAQKSLKGYYLATFTTVVGSGPSSFCLAFTSSGSWSSSGGGGLSGTYLTSGKKLYASAIWLASPAVYLSLQGSIYKKQGSGTFILSDQNGNVNGGGTYTMKGEQNKSCS